VVLLWCRRGRCLRAAAARSASAAIIPTPCPTGRRVPRAGSAAPF